MRIRSCMALVGVIAAFAFTVRAQTTAFTYQGSLKDGASVANGNYDFEFALFDAVSGGTQLGATLSRNSVAVANGIFTVSLDFGGQFPGANRFLEIRVRLTGGGGLTTLTPRQLVNSAPYSVKTLNTDQLGEMTSSGFIQNGTAVQVANMNISGNAVFGGSVSAFSANDVALGGTSQTGEGIHGESTNNSGVFGRSAIGSGVRGLTTYNGIGVDGESEAETNGGTGVYGYSVSGTGVVGESSNGFAGKFIGPVVILGKLGVGTAAAPADRLTVQTATGNYGFTHTDGTVTFGSFVGGSTGGAWFGTKTNHTLSLFVNGGAPSLTVNLSGSVGITTLGGAGSTALCRNASNTISTCSSSLRYKTNIGPFNEGMSLLNKLHPITFDWKDGGMHDLGFGAEDVEKVEPLLVTYNDKGQVEGVKYDRISVVLLNAVKEQQSQIEKQKTAIASEQAEINKENELIQKQQTEIDTLRTTASEVETLKKLVCSTNKLAEICKE